jgi:CBS domain-containing protein
MKSMRDILEEKGRDVVSVTSEHTVLEAIGKLIRHRIGSLVVLDGAEVSGILTERDVLKIVHEARERIDTAKVSEFMTKDVVCAVPEDDLDYVMDVMTRNRFRRMPVVEDGHVVGIVSIGDIVKAAKSEKEYENRLLREYIAAT